MPGEDVSLCSSKQAIGSGDAFVFKPQLKNQEFGFEKHICGVVSCAKGGTNVRVKISVRTLCVAKLSGICFSYLGVLCWPCSCSAITFPSTHYSQISLQTLTGKSHQEAAESKLRTHLCFV